MKCAIVLNEIPIVKFESENEEKAVKFAEPYIEIIQNIIKIVSNTPDKSFRVGVGEFKENKVN